MSKAADHTLELDFPKRHIQKVMKLTFSVLEYMMKSLTMEGLLLKINYLK